MFLPDDPELQLDIATIGNLTDAAYVHPDRLPTFERYTLSFWFFAAPQDGIRVIANQGNKTLEQAGWTVYLQEARLNVRVKNDEGLVQLSRSFSGAARWYQLTVVVDQVLAEVKAYLDEQAAGWEYVPAASLLEAGSVSLDTRLTLGGYTDSAGGHFNYRFGEMHAELIDDFRLYTRPLSAAELQAVNPAQGTSPTAVMSQYQDEDTLTVHVDASQSTGEGLTYVWNFGDGSAALGQRVRHQYAFTGLFTLTLSVFDKWHRHHEVTQRHSFEGSSAFFEKTPVFRNAAEGYACYRIPAIIKAANGDLIAFAEGRQAGCSDATQVIHIVCKRSTDHGKSWLPLQVVARNRMGAEEYACMNPAPVVDEVHGTGRIVVVYNKMETSEWAITEGKGVARVFCITSDDHGLSWTQERDITLAVHHPYNPGYVDRYPDAARVENRDVDWRKQVPTLGHAIQLRGATVNPSTTGRLFFIGCYTSKDDTVFDSYNYAFWSDDLGESWQLAETITLREDGSSARGLNEATAVELSDGSVLINSRNYQAGQLVGCRACTLGTFDQQGQLHFGRVRHDQQLLESGVQASLLKVMYQDTQVLLFVNPQHPSLRKALTLQLSFDEGRSWTLKHLIDPGPASYSDMVLTDSGELAILYEQGNTGGLVVTTLPLQEILPQRVNEG